KAGSLPAAGPGPSYTARPRRARARGTGGPNSRPGAGGDHVPPRDPTLSNTLLRPALSESDLPGLPLRHRGKVRDVFDLPGGNLLMVATDRLSAFDVVLPDPIPGKGEML